MNDTYIAQCAAATKLQEAWELKEGDYVFMAKGKDPDVELFSWADADCWKTKELQKEWGGIWLPTQEQLWAMLENNPSPKLFAEFLSFLGYDGKTFSSYKYPQSPGGLFHHMSELLLAFVMWRKYKKQWNSDKGVWK